MAGPATTVSSVTIVLQPVRTTYDCPLTPFGTATVKPPETGVATWQIGPVTVMKQA